MTGRQARASPISSTPKKKKWELEARNGRVAGRQLFISETCQRHSNNQTPTVQNWAHGKKKTHLLYIEDEKVFNGADGRQHRTVKSTDPANCLTVDDLQHVLRNGKLLLPPPLGQPTVTVPHDQPDDSIWKKTSRTKREADGLQVWPEVRPEHHSHRCLTQVQYISHRTEKEYRNKSTYLLRCCNVKRDYHSSYTWQLTRLTADWSRSYFLGNSTKMVAAAIMMKSKMVSLYISWPTRVSQHCREKEANIQARRTASTEWTATRNKLHWGLALRALISTQLRHKRRIVSKLHWLLDLDAGKGLTE